MASPTDAMMPRSAFHAGQYVIVHVSGKKREVGQIESLGDRRATVSTAGGYSVTRDICQLEPAWLVVLDLNGVLGFRKSSKVFKKRPHVDELLAFLFRHFVVGVWTSCAEHNGVRIISDVFGDLEERLAFKMFRDECTPNPTADNPWGTFKDLRRLWDRFPHFDATNTIMVDDSEDKCSHRHNALCPTPFTEETAMGAGSEHGLQEIITVLEEVLTVKSFEPVRRHMVARWGNDGRSPLNPATPVAGSCAGSQAYPAGSASSEPVLAPTAAAASDGPFAGSPSVKQSPERALARVASKRAAQQDANDSDEEGRPSVGTTPIMGTSSMLGTGPAVAMSYHSPPLQQTSPQTPQQHHHQQHTAQPRNVVAGSAELGATGRALLYGNGKSKGGSPTPETVSPPPQGATGGMSFQERMRAIALNRRPSSGAKR